MITSELRHGRWEDVLADVEADALIADPPYGPSTHQGHDARRANDGAARRDLSYAAWTQRDVHAFVQAWSPRIRGWMACFTSHDLIPHWEVAYGAVGRYAFAPVPCVIRGMTCRLAGDGPSSWAVYLMVARPRTKASMTGTLPGGYEAEYLPGETGYVVPRERGLHIGGKPLGLMRKIVRDYSRPGDTVVDPCAGGGTTLRAAVLEGRSAVGAEVDLETWRRATARRTG